MTWKQRFYGWGTILLLIVSMLAIMSVMVGCGNPNAQKGAFFAGCPCFLCF